ncbi:hypothetical protein [Lysobacter claricitrinus]|uniref:hypothetical protein n=1 Tax=Lysobacter claricitrinus TaxID=3367728 RepID=UPI0037DBD616
MLRTFLATALLVAATAASAAPTMTASDVIHASAAGAIAAATCGPGTADEHRRNAREGAKQMLSARHMLPKDFDARFANAYAAESKRVNAMTKGERKTMCMQLDAQGVHFGAKKPAHH